MRSLHEDPFYSAALDDAGIFHVRRSETTWDDLEQARVSTEAMVAAIRGVLGDEAKGAAILMDFRDARARNDEAFENTMERFRDEVRARFRRVAVLVRTQVGRMQIERLNEGRSDAPTVFEDREAALAWLQDGLSSA